MALTRVQDVIVPAVFSPYVSDMALATSRAITSGAVTVDPTLNAFLAGGGLTVSIPSWPAIDDSEAYKVPTDVVTEITPLRTTANRQVAVRVKGVEAYNTTKLASALAGSNPLQDVAARIATAINNKRQVALMAQLDGLFTTALEDLENDIASGVGAAGEFSKEALVDTMAPFGDFLGLDSVLVVHSDVYRKMQKEQTVVTNYIPVGEVSVRIDSYLGYPVIVDDNGTKVPGTTPLYKTYIVRPGAIGMGTGTVEVVPHSEPLQGNGGGVDYLILRDTFSFHVGGTRFTSDTITGETPSTANLALAANWAKVLDDKQIGVARLVSRL